MRWAQIQADLREKRVVIQIYLLLLSIFFIVALNMREYKVTEEKALNYPIEAKFWLTYHSPSCWYPYRNLVLKLDDCQLYPIGSIITFSSTQSGLTASELKTQKFLDSRHLSLISVAPPTSLSFPKRSQALLFTLRHQMQSSVSRVLPETSAQLLFSIVFGGAAHLTSEQKDQIKTAGLQDLLAASGMQVAILGLATLRLTSFLPRKVGLIAICFLLCIYAHLALLSVSILRATTMFALACLARHLGRQYRSLWMLILVALTFAWFDPTILSNISFQLSFGAVLSLQLWGNLIAPKRSNLVLRLETAEIATLFETNQTTPTLIAVVRNYLTDAIKTSLIVQLSLLPLLLYYFQDVSLISVLSSAVVVWLMPFLFVAGLLTIFSSLLVGWLVPPSLAPLIGVAVLPVIEFLQFYLKAVEPLSALRVHFSPTPTQLLVWYIALTISWLWFRQRRAPAVSQPIEKYLFNSSP